MHSRSPLTAANFLLILFVCATGGIVFAQNRPPDSTQSKYVGADVCQGCHEDQHKSFSASSHVATLKKEQLSQRGCEGCHGPGADHVEGGGDPTKIGRFSGASAAEIQSRCGHCHEANLGAGHSKARLTCLTCHSSHHYRQPKSILVASVTQLCWKCHHQSGDQTGN